MDKALEQFEEQFSCDASEAEKRWHKNHPSSAAAWKEFKAF